MNMVKQLIGKWIVPMAFATALSGVLVLGGVHVARAQSDPASVLVAWEKVALGDGQNLDAALALMTDDAVLKVVPPPAGTTGTWTGKEQIRQALIFNKAQNVKRENVGTPTVSGNNVSTVSMVSNNAFTMWGVSPVQHLTEAVVVDGKITSYVSTMAASERARVGAAAAAYQAAHAVQATDPASVLVAWEKVALGDSQDIDAALALMSDDAVLKVIPAPAGTSGIWTGKVQIRQALIFNKAQNVKRENVGTPTVNGNNVSTVSMVSNNAFTMWGVSPVEHLTEAVVVDGKITSYTSTMATSERGRVGAAADAYQAAQAQQGQQPDGMPRTGTGQGPISILLLALIALMAAAGGLAVRHSAMDRDKVE